MACLVHLSIHDRYPADVWADWNGDWEGASRRHPRALLKAGAILNGFASCDSKHNQYWCRSRGDGFLGAHAARAAVHLLVGPYYRVRYLCLLYTSDAADEE